jgi:hypothetical protein
MLLSAAKGQVSFPFTMIEAAITFMIIMGVIFGTQSYVETFLKEETVDLQAERIANAALALDTYPEGYNQLDITGYKFRIFQDSGGYNLTLKFNNKAHNQSLSSLISVNEIKGPSSLTDNIDGLCIEKKLKNNREIMEFKAGNC